mmetsp:Transcript_47648/g.137118  ORF Transcript_47648/g.137118 Transcript_47648/m.137118 type:complete len:452 (-) Transcript_47648:247-1602(-)
MAASRLSRAFEGFAGVAPTGFFGRQPWADGEKPPGHTSLTTQLGLPKTLWACVTLQIFFFSPSLIWFAIGLAVYLCFPYDFDAARAGWAMDWVLKRFAVTASVAFLYYGFFFWALYVRGLSKRKFRPGSYPTAGNMAHNLWYWALGVLQWTLTECAMVRLYATGKVPYIPDSELLRSPSQFLATALLVVLGIPVWREHHFYFAHRFTHIRAVYKYVHSFHHRNTDPEPFSGLCMHPVEHLLYFSNALMPALYFRCSPFVYFWAFLHSGLAPGAGHSGWEDHWQADQYHYLHHAKFECNYGSPFSGWIDQICGTFREKLGTSSDYKGEYKDDYDTKDRGQTVWSTQSYLGLQQEDHLAYTGFCLSVVVLLFASVLRAALGEQPVLPATVMGALVAYGPITVALLLSLRYDKMSWRWPFHNDRVFGAFGFFALAGWASCVVPLHHFVTRLCTP